MTDENLNIDTANESPQPIAQQDEVPPWRLVLTLAVAGALAGFLIVFVYVATLPAITAHKAEVLRLAVYEVLGSPNQVDTLYVVDGALTDELAEGQRLGGRDVECLADSSIDRRHRDGRRDDIAYMHTLNPKRAVADDRHRQIPPKETKDAR